MIRLDSTARCALLATALGTGTVAAEPTPAPYAEGKAYDRETGALLYREQHHCDAGHSRCTVFYRDAAGVLVARKELDYRGSTISPGLLLTNYRSNTKVRVPADGREDIVVDAGFDNFVRDQWDVLEAGEAVDFRFQVAGYDSPLDMVIAASGRQKCTHGKLCLRVDAVSWLVRALTDPIELFYSRVDRKLLRYRGISNLRDERGGAMHVDIVYDYGDAVISPAGTGGSTFQF